MGLKYIGNTARVLYQMYISGEDFSARVQCLNSPEFEKECKKL